MKDVKQVSEELQLSSAAWTNSQNRYTKLALETAKNPNYPAAVKSLINQWKKFNFFDSDSSSAKFN